MINEGSVEHMSDARGHSDLALPPPWLPLHRTNSTLSSLSCSNEALLHFNCLNAPEFPQIFIWIQPFCARFSTSVRAFVSQFNFFFNFHFSVENYRLCFLTRLKTLWAKTTLKLNFPCKHVCAQNHRLRNHLAQRFMLACCCCLPHLRKHC